MFDRIMKVLTGIFLSIAMFSVCCVDDIVYGFMFSIVTLISGLLFVICAYHTTWWTDEYDE